MMKLSPKGIFLLDSMTTLDSKISKIIIVENLLLIFLFLATML